MRNFYLRPDQVIKTGVWRPANQSRDLHAEIQAIASAFTEDPNTIAQEYGGGSMVATVPTAEPLSGYAPAQDLFVGPTSGMGGTSLLGRFFGRRR